MKVGRFLRSKKCAKFGEISSVVFSRNRYTVLADATKFICSEINRSGSSIQSLNAFESYISSHYDEDWFEPAEKERVIAEDTLAFSRFLNWLGTGVVVESNITASVPIDFNGSVGAPVDSLETDVHLIVSLSTGVTGAVIINWSKSQKGLQGKSYETNIVYDLSCLVAKKYLDKKYPGVLIFPYYMFPSEPGESVIFSGAKGSNSYLICYETVFGSDLMTEIDKALGAVANAEVAPQQCEFCSLVDCCYSKFGMTPISVFNDKVESLKVKNSSLNNKKREPSPEQKQVIEHITGPLLVCACPGSGKTFSLVERTCYLVERGIPCEFILLVSFTNKAVDELDSRLRERLGDNIPTVATINGLCNTILHNHKDIFGKEMPVLTSATDRKIILELLGQYGFPSLGVNSSVLEGKYGLVDTLRRLFASFMSNTQEFFIEEHPELNNTFYDMATDYVSIIRGKGYITFDQQISLVNWLFDNHPEILSIYRSIYKYIMVDEFQDINGEQAKFIYSLTTDSQCNLVVAGDDDQAIYGFRGGSHRFMIDFPSRFGAQTVVLGANYRSTKKLVESASKVINKNKERISKNVCSFNEEGVAPVFIEQGDTAQLDGLLEGLRKELQCEHHDIAIISTKNSTLSQLHAVLESPTVLAKNFLRDDILLLIIYSLLRLFYNGLSDDRVFYYYLQLFGLNIVTGGSGGSIYETFLAENSLNHITDLEFYSSEGTSDAFFAIKLISDTFQMMSTGVKPEMLLSTVSFYLGMEDTESVKAIKKLIADEAISSMESFVSTIDFIVKYQDETRVDSTQEGVILITAHESKGREYEAVVLYDDFTDVSFDETSRRVLYVAMTRARKRLVVVSQSAYIREQFEEKEAV